MKTRVFLFAILVCFLSVSAQKKKDLRKHHISCIITMHVESGKEHIDNKEFFNANGDKLLLLEYDKNGRFQGSVLYKYNNYGDVVEEKKSDRFGELMEQRIFVYNASRQKTTEIVNDKNGQLLKRFEYRYNKQGFKTERRHFDASNKLQSVKQFIYQNAAS